MAESLPLFFPLILGLWVCSSIVTLTLNMLATWRGFRFLRFARLKESLPAALPPVSIIVPVKGIEGEGIAHFQRFCNLDWPNYQVVFTLLHSNDPALPLLQQLQMSENCKITLQVGGPSDGENLKVRNLRNAFSQVDHDWILVCDADIRVEPELVQALISPLLRNPQIGLVHSIYRCKNEPSLAAAWENVWTNCDFWVQGLLGDWMRGTDFAFGAAMAFHRDNLQAIGGWDALKNHLADDYEMGHRISKLGRKIEFSRHIVSLEYYPASWKAAWNHLLRWSRTIRVCQPGGFAGSIILNMTLIALVGLFVAPRLLWPISLLLLSGRVLMAHQCRNGILGTTGLWKHAWMIPVKDLSQVLLWLSAFRNDPIVWRGTRFKLQSDGTLVTLKEEGVEQNFNIPPSLS